MLSFQRVIAESSLRTMLYWCCMFVFFLESGHKIHQSHRSKSVFKRLPIARPADHTDVPTWLSLFGFLGESTSCSPVVGSLAAVKTSGKQAGRLPAFRCCFVWAARLLWRPVGFVSQEVQYVSCQDLLPPSASPHRLDFFIVAGVSKICTIYACVCVCVYVQCTFLF